MRRTLHMMLFGSGVLLLISPLMLAHVQPNRYASRQAIDPDRLAAQNTGSIGQIMGQIRSGISDMMFMKASIYLHSGIRYGAHSHAEEGEEAEAGAETSGDELAGIDVSYVSEIEREVADMGIRPGETLIDGHLMEGPEGEESASGEEEEVDAPTVIPTAEDDFRGFIGRLERDVKPWRDPRLPHQHTSGDELLPWYRIMTLTDPTNVRGYMIGSWWLLRRHTETSDLEAMKFIDEGIDHNPDAFQLWQMKGRVHERLDEIDAAIEAWGEARRLGMEVRPEGGKETATWNHYMESDLRAAITFEGFHLARKGRLDDARRVANEALAVMPDFRPMNTLLEKLDAGEYDPAVE